MPTWTYNSVGDHDKNYLDSFTAAGWVALTLVIDTHSCDVSKVNTAAKRKAILQAIADELSLGTVPDSDWLDFTGGKMVILTIGNNTLTIRYITATNTAYIEIFLTAKFPPDFISKKVMSLLGAVDYTDHRIPRM